MKDQLLITRVNRNTIAKILESYSIEKLNEIPEGFSNNLIWNIAHIIVTQQLLAYKLSGLPMMLDEAMVERYKKGTKATKDVTANEVAEIKELLFTTLDQTEADIDSKLFANYTEYATSTGFVLKSISDAIAFNNYHEGIHLGYILALKKSL